MKIFQDILMWIMLIGALSFGIGGITAWLSEKSGFALTSLIGILTVFISGIILACTTASLDKFNIYSINDEDNFTICSGKIDHSDYYLFNIKENGKKTTLKLESCKTCLYEDEDKKPYIEKKGNIFIYTYYVHMPKNTRILKYKIVE